MSYGRDAPAPIELLTFHRQEEQEEIFGGRIRVQMPPAEGLAAVIGGFQGLGGSCPTIGPRRDFLSVGMPVVARAKLKAKEVHPSQLVVRFHEGRRQLPLVELRRSAA